MRNLLSFAALLALPLGLLRAQGDDLVPPGPNCNTWYADPAAPPGGPGTLAWPFDSVTTALTTGIAAGATGTLVLLPGVYTTPLETFPIVPRAGVSIQGTDALNTIIRQPGGQPALQFTPLVLDAYDDDVVDGLTIIGRGIVVDITDGLVNNEKVRSNPTIANCFISGGELAGVRILAINNAPARPAHDTNGNGWVENRPKLINNTIVGCVRGVLNLRTGTATAPGEGEPGLLNCLLSNNITADLDGVDAMDVITCAFATSANPAGVPAVFNTTTSLPQYVTVPTALSVVAFDLRVLPGSPAIDVGSLPATLAWPNGTTGSRTFACTVDIFDVDCEGYGNPRVARNAIDIGADESGELIVWGYAADTTEFNGTTPTINITVNPFPVLIGPFSGDFIVNSTGGPPFWQTWSPTTIQDVRSILSSPPTATPAGTLFVSATGSFNFSIGYTGAGTNFPLGFTSTGTLVQWNWQVWPTQFPTTFSVLSNLQTFFTR